MTHMQRDIEPTRTPQARVRDLMTPAPLTIAPATSVHEVYHLMQDRRIGHLPVCEDGRLVGLLSERDLRRVLPSPATSLAAHELHYLLERLTVAEIMTRFPVTIWYRSCADRGRQPHALAPRACASCDRASEARRDTHPDASPLHLHTVAGGTTAGCLRQVCPGRTGEERRYHAGH